MNSISINAPAKINIGLRVLEKRFDGYHNIQTLFYPIINLCDKITISKSLIDGISGNFPAEVSDKNNLIIKAKSLMEKEINRELTCKIKVEKNIPVGAGLGGGSSDAATTLNGLNSLFNLNIDKPKLKELSLQLGSDVPFFIDPTPAIGISRGEKLKKINFDIPYNILLINPHIHVSTKFAFENITPINEFNNYDEFDFSKTEKCRLYQNEIKNDFEKIIFVRYPEIKRINDLMLQQGALFSRMTGTGSTVFGVFKEMQSLKRVIELLPQKYFYHLEKGSE